MAEPAPGEGAGPAKTYLGSIRKGISAFLG